MSWSCGFFASAAGVSRFTSGRTAPWRPPGRVGLSSPLQHGHPAVVVGPPPVPLPQGSPRTRQQTSCPGPCPGEWQLHPQVVVKIWRQFGRAAVDLFASRASTHCPLFFSLRADDPPLGWDALAPGPPVRLLSLLPPSLCPPSSSDRGGAAHPGGPAMAPHALVFGHSAPPGWRALAAPESEGPPISGRRGSVPSFPCRAEADCLAPEREGLGTLGLPALVIDTMQESRSPPGIWTWSSVPLSALPSSLCRKQG